MVTRDELARLARREGLDVTKRTIRWWAKEGFLPRPTWIRGRGQRAFYPKRVLDLVRILAALRSSNVREAREKLREHVLEDVPLETEVIELDSGEVELSPSLQSWESGDFEYSLHLVAGSGLVVMKRIAGGEDELGEVLRGED